MTLRRPVFLAALAAAGMLLCATGAHATDPFYLELLRDGTHAYDRGDFAVAARTLRLACFGMLDDPKALAACLARLALAQDKASDVEGFRDTFVRLTEVEERFQAYSQADLPAEVRGALEQKLAARIPAPTLNSSPQAFRKLASKPAAAAPAQAAEKPAGKTTKPQPKNTPQPIAAPPAGPPPLSDEEKGKLETVRKLLGAPGSKSKELQQAFQIAQEVAAAHPEAMDAQRLERSRCLSPEGRRPAGQRAGAALLSRRLLLRVREQGGGRRRAAARPAQLAAHPIHRRLYAQDPRTVRED
jgi:hypothetical protein